MSNSKLEAAIGKLIESMPGQVGVYAETVDADKRLSINANAAYPTASSIKVFVLYTLLSEVDKHRISLHERVEYTAQFSTPGSGVMNHLDCGLKPTLKDLATLMMMISDNTATNLLIDYLGLGCINEAIADIPLQHTRIGNWRNFKDSDRDSFTLGESTPQAFAHFLLRMRKGELLSSNASELFWDILRIQKYIEPLRKHLPASPWAREWNMPEPVWVASKTGYLMDCTTESGLVVAHGAEWVISIMTRDMPDEEEDPDNMAEKLISEVSLLVYEAWSPVSC